MSFIREQNTYTQSRYYNEGLRQYLLKVYSYMAAALGITGVVAYVTTLSRTLMATLYQTPLHWILAFAPIVYVFVMASKLSSMRLQTARISLWVFSALMGLSLAWIFMVYTSTSIARVFFISASLFGAMAIYGNETKKDLTSMGSFLIMGVFGLIIASLINLFMHSSAMQFAISLLAVIIFTGLTAYDAQKIKEVYYQFNDGDTETVGKVAIMGALNLYFDCINLFINLLSLLGERK